MHLTYTAFLVYSLHFTHFTVATFRTMLRNTVVIQHQPINLTAHLCRWVKFCQINLQQRCFIDISTTDLQKLRSIFILWSVANVSVVLYKYKVLLFCNTEHSRTPCTHTHYCFIMITKCILK